MRIAIPATTTPSDLPAGWSYGAHAGGSCYHLTHTSGASVVAEERPDLATDDVDLPALLADVRLVHALRVAARAEAAAPDVDSWSLPQAEAARELTRELCRPYDHTTWAEALECLLGGGLAGHTLPPELLE